jgi:hypothetical protein
LENPLARMVLSGEIEEGAHVLVDAGSSGLTLTNQDVQVDTGNETAEPALV